MKRKGRLQMEHSKGRRSGTFALEIGGAGRLQGVGLGQGYSRGRSVGKHRSRVAARRTLGSKVARPSLYFRGHWYSEGFQKFLFAHCSGAFGELGGRR